MKRFIGCNDSLFQTKLPTHMILPIFDKYPMFSKKQYDYLRFKDALLSGIIH